MVKKTQKRLASQILVGEVRTLQHLNESTVLKSSHIKPFRTMKRIVSDIINMCESLTPGKTRRKVFTVMRRVNANPRWRSKGCGLSVQIRWVEKGTNSSFPYFMLSIKNILAVRSQPCVSYKYKTKILINNFYMVTFKIQFINFPQSQLR